MGESIGSIGGLAKALEISLTIRHDSAIGDHEAEIHAAEHLAWIEAVHRAVLQRGMSGADTLEEHTARKDLAASHGRSVALQAGISARKAAIRKIRSDRTAQAREDLAWTLAPRDKAQGPAKARGMLRGSVGGTVAHWSWHGATCRACTTHLEVSEYGSSRAACPTCGRVYNLLTVARKNGGAQTPIPDISLTRLGQGSRIRAYREAPDSTGDRDFLAWLAVGVQAARDTLQRTLARCQHGRVSEATVGRRPTRRGKRGGRKG